VTNGKKFFKKIITSLEWKGQTPIRRKEKSGHQMARAVWQIRGIEEK
jgi:hypothetical protein